MKLYLWTFHLTFVFRIGSLFYFFFHFYYFFFLILGVHILCSKAIKKKSENSKEIVIKKMRSRFGMKSSFCSSVPSHSPAVSLLSNKVHSECHNATDPFLDWYLFICLFISEPLLLIDLPAIPCFCYRTPSSPRTFVPNFFCFF